MIKARCQISSLVYSFIQIFTSWQISGQSLWPINAAFLECDLRFLLREINLPAKKQDFRWCLLEIINGSFVGRQLHRFLLYMNLFCSCKNLFFLSAFTQKLLHDISAIFGTGVFFNRLDCLTFLFLQKIWAFCPIAGKEFVHALGSLMVGIPIAFKGRNLKFFQSTKTPGTNWRAIPSSFLLKAKDLIVNSHFSSKSQGEKQLRLNTAVVRCLIFKEPLFLTWSIAQKVWSCKFRIII